MKKLLFLMLLLTTHILLSLNTAIAEKTMACETELAVGFAKVDGVWKPVKLDVPPFTIVISDDYKNIKMQRHEEGAQWRRKVIRHANSIKKSVCFVTKCMVTRHSHSQNITDALC